MFAQVSTSSSILAMRLKITYSLPLSLIPPSHSNLHLWILLKNRRKSQTNPLTFQQPNPPFLPLLTATTNINHQSLPFFLHLTFLGTESKQGPLQFGVVRCIAVLLQVEAHILAVLLIEGNGIFEVVFCLKEKTRRVFDFRQFDLLNHFLIIEQCGLWTQTFLYLCLCSHFPCSYGIVSHCLQSLACRCFSLRFLSRGRRTTEIMDDFKGIARRWLGGLGMHAQLIILIRILDRLYGLAKNKGKWPHLTTSSINILFLFAKERKRHMERELHLILHRLLMLDLLFPQCNDN